MPSFWSFPTFELRQAREELQLYKVENASYSTKRFGFDKEIVMIGRGGIYGDFYGDGKSVDDLGDVSQ